MFILILQHVAVIFAPYIFKRNSCSQILATSLLYVFHDGDLIGNSDMHRLHVQLGKIMV